MGHSRTTSRLMIRKRTRSPGQYRPLSSYRQARTLTGKESARTRDCGIANRLEASQSLASQRAKGFQMRSCLITAMIVLTSVTACPQVALAQTGEQSEAAKNQGAVTPQDLSGIWAVRVPSGAPWYNYALTADEPPMSIVVPGGSA